MSSTKTYLLSKKKELQEKIKPLRALESELMEVERLLEALDRHGNERDGHKAGCRCRECDPSW